MSTSAAGQARSASPQAGKAGSTHETAKSEWNTAANDMSSTLQRLGLTIGDVHQNYSAAEKADNDLWSGGVMEHAGCLGYAGRPDIEDRRRNRADPAAVVLMRT
ncbi:hypothetical protein GCM10023191_060990 [Actinoallomurus oryzae]|uniref:WXG100 family type VII secretion target n=1 Tax=Actinoallomurus oryzae TaxID=502180 RepID=A0ABP8QMK6_9ACTN